MPKISQLPQDTAPTTTDKVPLVDTETSTTKYALLSDLIATIFANATGSNSPVTRWDESFGDYVASGGVWSGDSYAVNRNASMTAMVVYINGRRISISAVTSRTFTASKDTYIDTLDNTDGTGTLVYTEVANNAASPALASNSLRIGIIVTGATTIAAVGSINQGQPNKVLPIASSVNYSVQDSLGNLICCRDPNNRVLGYRQYTSSQGSITSTVDLTGLTSCPVIVPANRNVIVRGFMGAISNSSAGSGAAMYIVDSTATVTIVQSTGFSNGANINTTVSPASAYAIPASGSRTFKAQASNNAGGTVTTNSSSSIPAWIMVEMI